MPTLKVRHNLYKIVNQQLKICVFHARKSLSQNIKYGSPRDLRRYEVFLGGGNDHLKDRISFRTIFVKGPDILLNGNPVFLRDISIPKENTLRGGRAYSREDAEMLLGWAKELGCNYVRLVHYPHYENMVCLDDEMGLMIWAEIPVNWTLLFERKETCQNTENQLKELIQRGHNRVSVVIWSMANEKPVNESRLTFIRDMVKTTRSIDPTRLVYAALVVHHDPDKPYTVTITDPLSEYLDLVSFNQYQGWYSSKTPKKSILYLAGLLSFDKEQMGIISITQVNE